MPMNQSISNERYLLQLFACALNGKKPDDIPPDCTWERIFELSKNNAVEGLIWTAASNLTTIPDDLREEWERVSSSILIRNIQLETERNEIVSRLADSGVSYLPLKGAALLRLYPNPSMRTMSDNDILYGLVYRSPRGGYISQSSVDSEKDTSFDGAGCIVRSVMCDMGYRVHEHSGDVCDIQFYKFPYYNYEMHYSLMEKHQPYYFYFSNPWKRAIPVGELEPGKGQEYYFSNEDQYIYMIAHAHKHEHINGEGIRILADIAVSIRGAGPMFDFNYIENELSKLNLNEFEKSLRTLSLAIVNEQRLEPRMEELAFRMISCGRGSAENSVRLRLANERQSGRWGRLGYLLKLASPDYYCPGELEFLARNRVLRPLFPLGRLFLFIYNSRYKPKIQLKKALTFLRGR